MFAKRVFLIAGLLGLIEIVPMFFMERYYAQQMPPPINHPEWFYGFLTVCLPWQFAFILISRDPVRYRPFMPLAILEKLGFVIAMAYLFATHRTALNFLPGPSIDAVWALLFTLAWLRTPRRSS